MVATLRSTYAPRRPLPLAIVRKLTLWFMLLQICCNCCNESRNEDYHDWVCGACGGRPAKGRAALVAARRGRDAAVRRGFEAATPFTGTVAFQRKNTEGSAEVPMQYSGDVDSFKRFCVVSFPRSDAGAAGNRRCARLWDRMCVEAHASEAATEMFGSMWGKLGWFCCFLCCCFRAPSKPKGGVTTCCVFNSDLMGKHGTSSAYMAESFTKKYADGCVCESVLEYVDSGADTSGAMKDAVGCQWFHVWRFKLDHAIRFSQTLILVTRDDGTIDKSQAGEKKWLDEQKIRYTTITLAEYAKAMGVEEA